jgi:hypothetical protein
MLGKVGAALGIGAGAAVLGNVLGGVRFTTTIKILFSL